ncbi:2,3,4,5-tetrahydropyridine-2,6-dicarboxylate N-acetyltransferase (plasmid) [Asticcacaulis sp. MM231]|uniref:acyltransferase n=1 Tax=Asticcacaulis sp. MM231 TaxID=3157666 RepID=UPI0032D5A75E
MRNIGEAIAIKLGAVLDIVLACRLCPDKVRKAILCSKGWKMADKSAVQWGVIRRARNVTIGRNTAVACHSFFDGDGIITLGEDIRTGPFFRILSTTHPIESTVPRRKFGADLNLHTRVEDGCWIGIGVTVLPGVTIARGCVVGAGAVVTTSTEPNGLYVGVPAKRIRDLPV